MPHRNRKTFMCLKNGCAFRVKLYASFVLLLNVAWCPNAIAQSNAILDEIARTPIDKTSDVLGVDYATARLGLSTTFLSFGDEGRPMTVQMRGHYPSLSAPDDPMSFNIIPNDVLTFPEHHNHNVVTPFGTSVFVPVTAHSQSNLDGTTNYYSNEGHGNTLILPTGSWSYPGNYVTGAGDVYHASLTHVPIVYLVGDESAPSLYDSISFADGETWSYFYQGGYRGNPMYSRPKFVVSSRGYGLQISYQSEDVNNVLWDRVSSITFYNKAFTYCNESLLVDCSLVDTESTKLVITETSSGSDSVVELASPLAVMKMTVHPILDPSNGFRNFYDITSLETPGVPDSQKTYQYEHYSNRQGGFDGDPITYDVGNYVSSASYKGAVWSHSWTNPTGSSVSPAGAQINANNNDDGQLNVLTYVENNQGTGPTWTWGYNGDGRLVARSNPEGDQYSSSVDNRGNILSTVHVPKPGSGLANITATAEYPDTCSNIKTCNKPLFIVDGNGNRTDYSYDENSGKISKQTDPEVGGIRPQHRYYYVQRYAWILNASGGYEHASSAVWVLSQESTCKSSAATDNPAAPCAGYDEIRTVYDYGPDSGPNNLFLRGKVVQSDGQTLRTCYGYNQQGRRIWETAPRAGVASCY